MTSLLLMTRKLSLLVSDPGKIVPGSGAGRSWEGASVQAARLQGGATEHWELQGALEHGRGTKAGAAPATRGTCQGKAALPGAHRALRGLTRPLRTRLETMRQCQPQPPCELRHYPCSALARTVPRASTPMGGNNRMARVTGRP